MTKKKDSSSNSKMTMISNRCIIIVTPSVGFLYYIQNKVDKIWPRKKVIMKRREDDILKVKEL